MADKETKITPDQRLNQKAKLKKKPSRRHPEQRKAEKEQDQAFAGQVPQQDASSAPPLTAANHEKQINEAAARLLAGTSNFLVGRSFASLIVPEDQQAHFSFLKNHALRKAASRCELRLKPNGQSVVYVHLEARAIYDEMGKHRQWRFGMIDITDLKQIEDELRKARKAGAERFVSKTASAAELMIFSSPSSTSNVPRM